MMINAREWPVRLIYILMAVTLAISLMITGASVQKVMASPGLSEWSRVSAPTTDGWVLTPDSVIVDYAVTDDGAAAYAILYSYNTSQFHLLKSTDGAATWDDIMGALEEEANGDIGWLVDVATDAGNDEFVAVALEMTDLSVHVFISDDGGATFKDAGEVEDNGVYFPDGYDVSDLEVSQEVGSNRNIAIGGRDNYGDAALFRCTITGDSATSWEGATDYVGWDDDGGFTSIFLTDIVFSPSWETDKTILVTTVADYGPYYVHLQCGSWGTTPGWNDYSTLGIEAVPIIEDVDIPIWLADFEASGIAGITVPSDYNSKDTNARVLWVWVNYYDEYEDDYPACVIVRVDDDSADPVGPMGQIEDGELWLTNVSYKGTIDEGEAIAGVLGTGTYDPVHGSPNELITECCEGVQVYRNDGVRNMDICCIRWADACKPPTGTFAMAVSYVGEDKAYAVSLWGFFSPYDEDAWSVSFDDGDFWSQLSLIDTHIDYLTDAAVSPDCNKTMLVSANEDSGCECDSVWLKAENLAGAPEYSGRWLRTWCGHLEGPPGRDWELGLLRLAPEETNGDNVYLFDYATSNVYWNNEETLACWDPIGSTVLDEIVDVALQDADTLFALDRYGDVAMFDDDEWEEAVDSEVELGHTIAVWGDHILVGGDEGEVSYSDDGGETFALLEDVPTIDGWVTVAFDTYFDTNNVIYAATDEDDNTGGIYRWVIGESESWTNLHAEPLECDIGVDDGDELYDVVDVVFTGLVVDRPSNPFTSADNGGVIYASYYGYYDGHWFTGVARSLEREVTINMTCVQWDFLHVGLTIDVERFDGLPDALKICGCLTPDSNTRLFAIDGWGPYDYYENEYGSVWTYEDCYAKTAPILASPADGATIRANRHACVNHRFTLEWDHLGDTSAYDIQIARDADFTEGVVNIVFYEPRLKKNKAASYIVAKGTLSCGVTYYWRVKSAKDQTGQVIHSWWSEPRSFTVVGGGG